MPDAIAPGLELSGAESGRPANIGRPLRWLDDNAVGAHGAETGLAKPQPTDEGSHA